MKSKIKLKSSRAAAVHSLLFGDSSGFDLIENYNNSILADTYKQIQFSLLDYAYISTGSNKGGLLYVISLDTVYVGAVRVSCFVRFGSGDGAVFRASSHKTFGRVCDFLRYGLPAGWLHFGPGWYVDQFKKGVA